MLFIMGSYVGSTMGSNVGSKVGTTAGSTMGSIMVSHMKEFSEEGVNQQGGSAASVPGEKKEVGFELSPEEL